MTHTAPPKPTALPVLFDSIPAVLRAINGWFVWKYTKKNGKWTKPPSCVRGGPGSSTDPSTWATFEQARAAYEAGGWDGVGVVHLPEHNLTGCDLDKCRDPETGELGEAEARIVVRLDTYAEVSPSATGVRTYAFGRKPGRKCKRDHYEMYDGLTKKGTPGGRFLTVTGRRIEGSPATINDRQAVIDELYAEWFGPKEKKKPTNSKPVNGEANGHGHEMPVLSDDKIVELLRREKNGKAGRLLDGEVKPYKTPSEADAALAAKTVFYTRDRDQVIRILRGSGLARDKLNRDDYAELTADGALALVTVKYEPRNNRVKAALRKAVDAPPPDDPPAEGDGQGDKSKEPVWPPPAVVVLRQWIKDTYGPTFRRGRLLYSAALGREISTSEISGTPTSNVLAMLALQEDAPRLRGTASVDLQSLPYHYRTWLPVAWGDLAAGLPEEADSAEMVEPAREEFIRKLSGALLTMVPLAYQYKGEEMEIQRRPILEWARMFAKTNSWAGVRGFRLWGRKDGDGFRAAIRAELFGQIHSDLKGLGQKRLTELCQLYGVGTGCHVGSKTARATELTADFLADLLAEPVDPPKPTETRTQEEQKHAPRVRGFVPASAFGGLALWVKDLDRTNDTDAEILRPPSASALGRTNDKDADALRPPPASALCVLVGQVGR